jgi:hypothetical protein
VLAVSLVLISFIPLANASVVLDEEGELSTFPGNPVYLSFIVTNSERMTVSVEVIIETDWDVYTSANNFFLVYNQYRTVDIELTPAEDSKIGQMETVTITFKETSTLNSQETDFTFNLKLVSEGEYYGEPESMAEILFGHDGIDPSEALIVVILVILIAVAIISIKKRFVADSNL